jgi:hypothetical protein
MDGTRQAILHTRRLRRRLRGHSWRLSQTGVTQLARLCIAILVSVRRGIHHRAVLRCRRKVSAKKTMTSPTSTDHMAIAMIVASAGSMAQPAEVSS